MRYKLSEKIKNETKEIKYFNKESLCQVSKASNEIMLYRVCNGNELEFPFSN